MVAVGFDALLAEAEKPRGMDRQAAFFFRFAARGLCCRLHMIDFAADDTPMAGFRRLQALAKQELAVIQDGKPTIPHRGNQCLDVPCD